MNRVVTINLIRFIVLVLLQSLVLRRITFDGGSFGFIHFIVYPIFILLLPFRTPREVVLILAFIMGFCIDLFYESLGIHAATLVFTAYARGIILKLMEPYGGYDNDKSPTLSIMGPTWFATYLGILMAIHTFFYFSVEAFSFVFIFEIIMNTIFSFTVSFILLYLSQMIIRNRI